MLFRDRFDKRTAPNFVRMWEKVRLRPWQCLYKRSGKKAWAVHGKSELTETEKRRDNWRATSRILLSDVMGIVHKVFVLAGQIVNSAYYCDVWRRLRENLRRFRPELRRRKNWLLHHDNAQSHTSFLSRECFTKNNSTVCECSSDVLRAVLVKYVLCASVLVKCLVREFKWNTTCETSSEVILLSVLVKYFGECSSEVLWRMF
jgi:hypothetical protein